MTPKNRTLNDALYSDPLEDEILSQVKCTACNCVLPFFKDLSGYAVFMKTGWGLRHCAYCINRLCGCHTGSHPLPRILIRDVTMAQAFGVAEI